MKNLKEQKLNNIYLNNKNYEVIITFKNIKNMYLRVKKDLKIYITCSKYVDKKTIEKFINDNKKTIESNLIRYEFKNNDNKFWFLGNSYDFCYINTNEIIFGNSKVFIGKNVKIDNWYRKYAEKYFEERLDIIYHEFKENIPYPNIKIRKMTSRWGVCNIKTKIITLNLELIKYDKKYLDYVIVHELSHFIYPNHSKEFWEIVKKYIPNYKIIRNEMKNFV